MALTAAAFIVSRKPKPAAPGEPGKGFVSRLIAKPSAGTAFVAGLLVFTPSITFIAAVQAIATARASFELSVLALAIVVALNVLLVWLPILAHMAVPE